MSFPLEFKAKKDCEKNNYSLHDRIILKKHKNYQNISDVLKIFRIFYFLYIKQIRVQLYI